MQSTITVSVLKLVISIKVDTVAAAKEAISYIIKGTFEEKNLCFLDLYKLFEVLMVAASILHPKTFWTILDLKIPEKSRFAKQL